MGDKTSEKVDPLGSDFFLSVGLRKTKNANLPLAEKIAQRWKHEIPNILESQDTLSKLTVVREDLVRLCISSVPNSTVTHKSLQNLVSYLTDDTETYFIEEFTLPTLHNMIAGKLTRELPNGDNLISKKGLLGQGQVIGVADSGLDFDHCFFADNPVHDFRQNERNNAGRKIIRYHKLPGADYKDPKNGHGTHVVGSIVGSVDMNLPGFTAEEKNNMQQYHGSAPEAKIVFQDLMKDGAFSGLRNTDIGRDLFQVAYDVGARIHSNSWGRSQNVYGDNAREVDRFTYANPDFLILIAAGNDGVKDKVITGTVGSPATCKNGLAIGASQTSHTGWETAISYTDWKYMYDVAKKTSNGYSTL